MSNGKIIKHINGFTAIQIDSPGSYSCGEYSKYSLFKDLAQSGISDYVKYFVFWYSVGSYCGAGQALMGDGSEWWIKDMGHCSCYGPLEKINEWDANGDVTSRKFSSLDELLKNGSKEWQAEVKPLVDAAKEFINEIKKKNKLVSDAEEIKKIPPRKWSAIDDLEL